jgi:hypothetical protein
MGLFQEWVRGPRRRRLKSLNGGVQAPGMCQPTWGPLRSQKRVMQDGEEGLPTDRALSDRHCLCRRWRDRV